MSAEAKGGDFVISRIIEAPRDRVWQALVDPEQVKHWWAPPGFSVIVANLDLRPGGVFLCGMRSFEGYKIWGKFTYQEIVPPARIVFLNSFSNESGAVTRNPIVPTWPLETLTGVNLEEEAEDKTKVDVRWAAHNATEAEQKTFDSSHVGMKATWGGTLDRLAAYLAKAA